MSPKLETVLEVAGIATCIIGLALIAVPVALIVAGALVALLAAGMTSGRGGRRG